MNELDILKNIMPLIETDFLHNTDPTIICSGYEYFREITTLYAKQHNMVESTVLLLDNNMNEEAIILARSILNNYFLIGYLIDDDKNKTRLNEYHVQPLLYSLKFWKNCKRAMKGTFGKRIQAEGKAFSFTEQQVDDIINDIKSKIIEKGFTIERNLLSIRKLAEKSGVAGLELYVTFYAEASKFEHSDITSLNIYKQQILSDVSNNTAFIMDLNSTDEELRKKTISMITLSYLGSFNKILELISKKEPHLINNYDKEKLMLIGANILAFSNQKPR